MGEPAFSSLHARVVAAVSRATTTRSADPADRELLAEMAYLLGRLDAEAGNAAANATRHINLRLAAQTILSRALPSCEAKTRAGKRCSNRAWFPVSINYKPRGVCGQHRRRAEVDDG